MSMAAGPLKHFATVADLMEKLRILWEEAHGKTYSKRITVGEDMAKERAVDEAIAALWQVIDEARDFLTDPHSTPNDKKTWAKILGDTVAIFNKVLESQKKDEKIEEDDLQPYN